MSTYAARLAALREQLSRQRLDGFVVPLTDEHMSEYVGAYAQRLAWLTGFQGSAGTAVVLPQEAAIFTDGRYTLQVREQVSADDWQFVGVPDSSVAQWLGTHAGAGARIGYDPWLHTRAWVDEARAALAGVGAELVAVDGNPVDAVWPDRPAPSAAPLTVQPDALAGRSSASKRADVADWLTTVGAEATVIAALDSIAWLFNVRGADVARTPVALSYAIVHRDGTADLYVAPEKMTSQVAEHLGNAVRVHDRAAFAAALDGLAGRRVAIDPALAVSAIFDRVERGGGTALALRDPTVVAKATKNTVEIAGHRAASLRDGAALTRFLRWIADEAPRGGQTEWSAAAKLEAFRRETGALRDLSFDAISATGPHGAIPHYHVTEESNLPIENGQLYLIDSGGQYQDGTTDVTRVVPIGSPSAEMRDRYTRVLKGHIALATATFPKRPTGCFTGSCLFTVHAATIIDAALFAKLLFSARLVFVELHRLQINFGLDEFFDIRHQALVTAGHKTHRQARRAGAAGAADTVHIVFSVERHIEVKHSRHVLDVQPASGHIGAHQQIDFTRFKGIKRF